MKKVIVIEDNLKHIKDAEAVLCAVPDLEVIFHDTIDGARREILNTRSGKVTDADGVITDLFFDPETEPNGLVVMADCLHLDIPCVICTAGYRHGKKYNWANQMLRAMRGPEMVDHYSRALGTDFEAETKNWAEALKRLNALVAEKEQRELSETEDSESK